MRVRGRFGSLAISIEDPENVGTGLVTLKVDGQPIPGSYVSFPKDETEREEEAVHECCGRPDLGLGRG